MVTETSTNESFECSCIFGFIVEKPLSKPESEPHQNLLSRLVNQHSAETQVLPLHTAQDQKQFFFFKVKIIQACVATQTTK